MSKQGGGADSPQVQKVPAAAGIVEDAGKLKADRRSLSPALVRLTECKSVMRTKLINHGPSQQQECTRNALAAMVSQISEKIEQ